MKTALLIYNPVAGRRRARRAKKIEEAAAALRAGGLAVEVARTYGPGTARHIAQAAATDPERLILVCGGNGTVNEVLNGIAPGTATLGILPGGTANIIAKELRLPHDLVEAAHDLPYWLPQRIALGLASWTPRGKHSVDTGLPFTQANAGNAPIPIGPIGPVERRYFLSVAGIGFDAYIVQKLSEDLKLSLGVVAYGLEGLRQVLRYPFPSIVCRVDGQERRGTFAVIQRTERYAGWFHMAPGASIFEPKFDLCLFKSSSRVRYFVYAAALLARQHLRLRDVELLEARRFICAAPENGQLTYFELDGEFAGELPATFEIVPAALTLLVPEERGLQPGS